MVKKEEVVAAFNIFNNVSIDAVLGAAKDANKPVILEVNETDLYHCGIEELVETVRIKAERTKVDAALHLDHGMSLEIVAKCIRAGFSSVMIDPTNIRTDKRIQIIKEVVDFAHPVGVMVESMLGQLKLAFDTSGEGGTFEKLTDPDEANQFANLTGIDILAVSVGTEHGSFIIGKKAEIDMVRLHKISENVAIPLVVHGGSAVSDEQLRNLRNYHVGKMNIGSAIRMAYKKGLLEAFNNNETIDIIDADNHAKQYVYEAALHKIKVLSY
jgi:ketose-bisphosphate aldolase